MMNLIINLVVLLGTFYALAVICDRFFVLSLEKIADRFQMNPEVAGATLMAVGSSAPELFISLFAVFRGTEELSMGAGTIVGSALFNILIIIGASALFMTGKQKLAWQPVIRDMVFYSFAIVLLIIFFADGRVFLWEGLVLVFVYIVYVFMVKKWSHWLGYEIEQPNIVHQESDYRQENFLSVLVYKMFSRIIPNPIRYYIPAFLVSIGLIAGVSYVMVNSAVVVAEILHIPGAIIGLTILAIGTSVPDLISSLIVAKKGKADMAVSNAVGSNVFDIFIGLGFIYTVYFTIVNPGVQFIEVDNSNLNSSILLLFATVLALIFLLLAQKWRLGKYSGWLLIGLYLAYLGFNVFKVL